MKVWFWPMAVLLVALLVTEAHADIDPFEFQIYGYYTEGKGDLDPELLHSFVTLGHKTPFTGTSQESSVAPLHMMRNAMEFEYGLTDKIDFAYYVNTVTPFFAGMGTQYAGSKFRFHGRWWEENQLPINVGWYLETEWWDKRFNKNTVEQEFMLILQKDIGRWTITLNAPDFEFALVGPSREEGLEFGYRAEARYLINPKLALAVQGYGSSGPLKQSDPISEQQHYVMPTVWTVIPAPDSWFLAEDAAMSKAIPIELGLGFGLTKFSDTLLFRLTVYFGGSGGRTRDSRRWWQHLVEHVPY